MAEPEHQRLLRAALAREAEAHQLLLAGDLDSASRAFADVATLYRRSWEQAPPRAFGRLVGMLKAAILAGGGEAEAREVLGALGKEPDSPVSAYALALAALAAGDDALAEGAAASMSEGGDAFGRAGAAISALARSDREAYAEAIAAIVADFSARDEHLTGVAIADTAAVLERLAGRRGITAGLQSPLLP